MIGIHSAVLVTNPAKWPIVVPSTRWSRISKRDYAFSEPPPPPPVNTSALRGTLRLGFQTDRPLQFLHSKIWTTILD